MGFFIWIMIKGGVTLKEQLTKQQMEAIEINEQAEDIKQLQDIQVSFLGRRGSITSVLRGMGKLEPEERPIVGQMANEVRETISTAIGEKKAVLEAAALEEQLANEKIDVTLPGRRSEEHTSEL